MSAKLQRSIKNTVVAGEKNETLPPSGIEPRMFSPGVVHSMHNSAYWTPYLLAARSVAEVIIRRFDAVSYRLTIIGSLHNLWTKAIFLFADSDCTLLVSTLVICELRANHYSQSSQSVDKRDFLIRRFSLYTGNLRTTGKSLFAVYTICGQRRFSYSQIQTVHW